MKLGTLLIRDRVITLDQLEAALRAQVLFGGKLGSNLVELGSITADQLAVYLGKTLSLPAATREVFEAAEPAARTTLSADVARILVAYPLRLVRGTLVVAVANPSDKAMMDALARATGMPLELYVAPETLIEEFLAINYGVERRVRVRIAPAKRTPPPPPKPKRRPPVTPPPGLATSFSDTLGLIENATEKGQIADAVLAFARGRLDTAHLFLVKQDEAVWWKGFGPGVEAAALEGQAISLWTPSCLSIAFGSHAPWRGRPTWVDDPLWALLRTPPPVDAFVAPISIGNYVANLFYTHGEALDDGVLDAVGAVCEAGGEAYERLLQSARAGET